MKVKDLIKELDPDYVLCIWCKRFMHISETQKLIIGVPGNNICLDQYECNKHDELKVNMLD